METLKILKETRGREFVKSVICSMRMIRKNSRSSYRYADLFELINTTKGVYPPYSKKELLDIIDILVDGFSLLDHKYYYAYGDCFLDVSVEDMVAASRDGYLSISADMTVKDYDYKESVYVVFKVRQHET